MAGLLSKLIKRQRGAVGPVLTRAQATAARPVRNPSLSWYENDEGLAVVTLPRRDDLRGKLMGWAFMVPESRPIVLDEIGTMVWKLCDGERSFHEVMSQLATQYSITPREAEVSLAEFMRILGKRGMLAFILPDKIAGELTPDQRRALGVKATAPEAAASEEEAAAGESADEDEKPAADGPKPASRRKRDRGSREAAAAEEPEPASLLSRVFKRLTPGSGDGAGSDRARGGKSKGAGKGKGAGRQRSRGASSRSSSRSSSKSRKKK